MRGGACSRFKTGVKAFFFPSKLPLFRMIFTRMFKKLVVRNNFCLRSQMALRESKKRNGRVSAGFAAFPPSRLQMSSKEDSRLAPLSRNCPSSLFL